MLGGTIRKRIRQISVDGNNSMSNLAQLIIGDLSSASNGVSADEPEESSSYLNLASTLPASLLHNNTAHPDNELSMSNHF